MKPEEQSWRQFSNAASYLVSAFQWTALKRALYLDPELVLAHFALGNLARLQGKSGDACRHFANTLALLDRYQPGDILPESDGMMAQRLREIIEAVNLGRVAA